jgi:proteasome accessory factor B
MAERVERLTNLLALLLETAQPLSLVEITGELVGQYPDGQTARARQGCTA